MTESGDPLYTICFPLPAGLTEDQAGRIAESLGEGTTLSVSLMRKGDPFTGEWALQWLVEGVPDRAAIMAVLTPLAAEMGIAAPVPDIAPLPEVNWLEQSYRQFPPFSVGPFFIHGSHCNDLVPDGQTGLEIEAATAFGSGEHGTTSGCLILLDRLKQNGFEPENILDMGCGSGILAIAATKLWDRPVLAVDIDPESIRVTENHANANAVSGRITGIAGDGFAVVDGAFDLIIANILPNPLKEMAPALMDHLNPGGHAILSGLLLDQAQAVLDVYAANGATLVTRLDRGEWTALLLRK